MDHRCHRDIRWCSVSTTNTQYPNPIWCYEFLVDSPHRPMWPGHCCSQSPGCVRPDASRCPELLYVPLAADAPIDFANSTSAQSLHLQSIRNNRTGWLSNGMLALTFAVAECNQIHFVAPFHLFDIVTETLGANTPHWTRLHRFDLNLFDTQSESNKIQTNNNLNSKRIHKDTKKTTNCHFRWQPNIVQWISSRILYQRICLQLHKLSTRYTHDSLDATQLSTPTIKTFQFVVNSYSRSNDLGLNLLVSSPVVSAPKREHIKRTHLTAAKQM